MLEQRPHLLIEGALIAALATLSENVYIYIRKEYYEAARQMQRAIDDARDAGLIGKGILGGDFHCEVAIHPGAGA